MILLSLFLLKLDADGMAYENDTIKHTRMYELRIRNNSTIYRTPTQRNDIHDRFA